MLQFLNVENNVVAYTAYELMEFKETETKSNKLIVTIKLINMIVSMFN